MDTEVRGRFRRMRNQRNDKTGGIVLIIIGVLFLLHKIPQTAEWFPSWFLTWPMLLIGIGLLTAVKSRFRNPGWVILMALGGYFLLLQNNLISWNLRPYIFPVGIILLGIFITIKKNRQCNRSHPRFRKWDNHPGFQPQPADNIDLSEDVVNVSSTFGNIERNVFSKNLKGGNISSMFGGAQINFSQADFEGVAVIDLSIIFGGVDMVIPSNWNVKNEMSVIFGGIEDRRTVINNVHESGKTLVLKGNIMFGGMEIKSY